MNIQTLKQKIQNSQLTKDEIEELKAFIDTGEKLKKEFQITNESKYLATKEDIANLETRLIEKLTTKKELTTQINSISTNLTTKIDNINKNLTDNYPNKEYIQSALNKQLRWTIGMFITIFIGIVGVLIAVILHK